MISNIAFIGKAAVHHALRFFNLVNGNTNSLVHENKLLIFSGVSPGKAAVMQICGDNSCCHVLHLYHSGIPEKLQSLLEDQTSLKVLICIFKYGGHYLKFWLHLLYSYYLSLYHLCFICA